MEILLVSARPEGLAQLDAALKAMTGLRVNHAGTGEEALILAGRAAPHLVVIDQDPGDSSPLDLVAGLLRVNALINTAVVSDLNEDQFHEASEGLGIMARLPQRPGGREAGQLIGRLRDLMNCSWGLASN